MTRSYEPTILEMENRIAEQQKKMNDGTFNLRCQVLFQNVVQTESGNISTSFRHQRFENLTLKFAFIALFQRLFELSFFSSFDTLFRYYLTQSRSLVNNLHLLEFYFSLIFMANLRPFPM